MSRRFNGVTLLTPYRSDGKVVAKWHKCGHTKEVMARSLRRAADDRGYVKCPICWREETKIPREFVEKEISRITHREYKFIKPIGEWRGSCGKIKVLHKTCGHTFTTSWHKFSEGRRCPECAKKSTNSKAQQLMKRVFEHTGVDFEEEKTWDGLVNPFSGKNLHVDFYLPKLNVAIEIDGIQHVKSIDHWGGRQRFVQAVFRDRLKEEFLKEKGIKLFRIPLYNENGTREISYDKARRVVFNFLLKIHKMLQAS